MEIRGQSVTGLSGLEYEKLTLKKLSHLYQKAIAQDIPRILKNQNVAKDEEIDTEGYLEYAETYLQRFVDKLGVYMADNLFDREEVVSVQKKVCKNIEKRQKMAQLLVQDIEELNEEISHCALKRY